MQALFFIALFSKSSREALLEMLEWLLPVQLPGLQLQHSLVHEMHLFINKSILKFQVRVSSSSNTSSSSPASVHHHSPSSPSLASLAH